MVDRVPEYIRKLVPYQPGKPIEEVEREYGIANSVKLASNENPLGPSPKADTSHARQAGAAASLSGWGLFLSEISLGEQVGD